MPIQQRFAGALLVWLVMADSVMPIVLTMGISEFVALQRLSDSERRIRFNLPEWCDPTVAARRAGRTRVTVVIGCSNDDQPEAEDTNVRREPNGGVTSPR